MKLIIAGATGFVAEEVIRQSLRMRQITSVVALARKPVQVDPSLDVSKLKSIVVKDYGEYPEDVRKEFAGADACIWTVAITPSKSRAFDFAEVKRVCQDCTMAGLQAMYEAGPGKPFRFLYMSGIAAQRDQDKTPSWSPQYSLMRGETENKVLAFAGEHKGEVEASVAKPGIITASLARWLFGTAMHYTAGVPSINRADLAAAMLAQVINGFEKDPLMNDDLVRLGREAQAAQK